MTKHATEEGTRRYRVRMVAKGIPETGFRELGRTKWATSVLGFGCYRVDVGVDEHRKALAQALGTGCNLIDTSTNYSDGGSEECVGEILAERFQAGSLRRDEVVVVSKVGYVQGLNLDISIQREQSGNPFPEMVKYAEGCWHCIHPDFIDDQLGRSLARLELDTIDVYLLHNPEYFFSDAAKQGISSLETLREAFYERIRRAFMKLEDEVARGRIQAYGVSSNTFGGPEGDEETTSLDRMIEIAEVIGKERFGDPRKHHFSVAQLPMNLFEPGGVSERNNGGRTFLDLARVRGIGVLVNRPLNAFAKSQLVRLADFPVPKVSSSPKEQAAKVRALEEEFGRDIAGHIQTEPGSVPAKDFFRWGRELGEEQADSIPLEHWTELESQMVRPQLHYLVDNLGRHLADSPLEKKWEGWRDRYIPELDKLLLAIRSTSAQKSQKVSDDITKRLAPFIPEDFAGAPLSRKALAVLINTAGVSCVLNGMRKTVYVDDSLSVMKWKPFEVPVKLYEAFRLK